MINPDAVIRARYLSKAGGNVTKAYAMAVRDWDHIDGLDAQQARQQRRVLRQFEAMVNKGSADA
jgi:hypothetical protein